jgi:hypothetical protein
VRARTDVPRGHAGLLDPSVHRRSKMNFAPGPIVFWLQRISPEAVTQMKLPNTLRNDLVSSACWQISKRAPLLEATKKAETSQTSLPPFVQFIVLPWLLLNVMCFLLLLIFSAN